MKIWVYTIAKNEADNLEPWLNCTDEADGRCVIDTGSTDGTLELLLNVRAGQASPDVIASISVQPWRWDDAFNAALFSIPADVDVCVRLDMDERLRPGWRAALEAAWTAETTMLRYPYNYSEEFRFHSDRIHRRHGYRWRGATHEHLIWRGEGQAKETWTQDVVVDHLRAPGKAHPEDLRLLAESAAEHPADSEIALYYARELVHFGDARASSEVRRAIDLIPAHDTYRIAYAYRLLAKAEPHLAFRHLATALGVHANRSVLYDRMVLWTAREAWSAVLSDYRELLTLPMDTGWMDDPASIGPEPHDRAAVAAYRVGDGRLASQFNSLALMQAPNDPRLLDNQRYYEALASGAAPPGPAASAEPVVLFTADSITVAAEVTASVVDLGAPPA